MGHRRSYPNGNPDLRRRCQVPAPEIEEIEQLFSRVSLQPPSKPSKVNKTLMVSS